ncbi:MAG: hypothetical protein IPM57_00845 [Oligoflexia bacterium]|nr:hypothetical protein [Oligoflexia bacterium]
MKFKINLKYLFLLVVGIILFQILRIKPFFGLMDDAVNMFQILPGIKLHGLLSYSLEYLKNDLAWGMIRPFYPLQVAILYQVGHLFGPTSYYLFNAIIVFLVLFFSAHVYSKILNLNRYIIILAALCFPYTYDLFQHPSLQEKFVLFFGALLLFYLNKISEAKVKDFALVTLICILGYLTKGSFAIYFPMALLLLIIKEKFKIKHNVVFLFYFVLLNTTCIFLIKKIASHGSYTSSYSFNKFFVNMQQPYFVMLFLVLLFGFLLIFNKIRKNKDYLQTLSLVGLVGFIFLFLPWSLAGYILSLSGLFVGLIICQILTMYKSKVLLVFVCLFSILLSILRTEDMFSRLADIKSILNKTNYEKIYMPCLEGANSLRIYFEGFKKSNNKVI